MYYKEKEVALRNPVKGDDKMVNAARLKGRMREKCLTQSACAERLHIRTPTFNQKLNNIRAFSLQQAEELANMLEIKDSEFGSYFFCR